MGYEFRGLQTTHLHLPLFSWILLYLPVGQLYASYSVTIIHRTRPYNNIMGRALPTTMLWFLSLTLSLLVFANGTVTTFSLNLCHVKHSSVGLRINTGDGDWLERPPYLAATGKDSTVWSVSMPPTPPPPTGGWVGNGNVPYNGNPCAAERSN